jgi:hypothetical protein
MGNKDGKELPRGGPANGGGSTGGNGANGAYGSVKGKRPKDGASHQPDPASSTGSTNTQPPGGPGGGSNNHSREPSLSTNTTAGTSTGGTDAQIFRDTLTGGGTGAAAAGPRGAPSQATPSGPPANAAAANGTTSGNDVEKMTLPEMASLDKVIIDRC